MIERVAGGAALSVAAAATAAVPRAMPEVWHLLGYPFEAAGMIAALFACLCARFWSGNQLERRKAFRWTADMPVSALTLAVVMAAVIAFRPEPLPAIGIGAGVGILGEGLFTIARKYIEKFDLFGAAPPAPISLPPTPVPPEMTDLTRKIDEA